jgi:hypothetical protein
VVDVIDLTSLVGAVSICADHERSWWRRRRLRRLTADLACAANELSAQRRRERILSGNRD